jgi:uroporphyrinogen decarboxylase
MTSKERIERALRRQQPDRIPTFEWFIDPAVGEALTGSRDLLDIIESLDIDAVNIRPDYRRQVIDQNTFSDEWGTVRQDTGDVLPAITANPIADLLGHRDFSFPDPAAAWRFESLERAVERFGDQRAVILNVRDGFSDLRDLLGYEEALVSLMAEPDALRDLLARVVDFNLALARTARQRCGVNIVATTDDVAFPHGLLISPDVYHDILGPAFREVIAGFKSEGYLCIKHSDGDVSTLIDFWIDAGIDCLDPIDPRAGLDLAEIKHRHGDRICLKGNVDCAGVLQSGTPEEVAAATRECIRAAGTDGFILSSSNTIHRGVKPENYRAMLDQLASGHPAPPDPRPAFHQPHPNP